MIAPKSVVFTTDPHRSVVEAFVSSVAKNGPSGASKVSVAIVSCYKGMTASGGAEGVGRAVNQAVVISFLGIFAFNYVFTQTLLATHPEISVIK
jgi:ABC-type transporter Mla maintaining outer membrane lipid asymmetry permease subunit MlaE